jgi:hypothetical protein
MTYQTQEADSTARESLINDYFLGKYDTSARRTPVEILNETPRARVVVSNELGLKELLEKLLPKTQAVPVVAEQ